MNDINDFVPEKIPTDTIRNEQRKHFSGIDRRAGAVESKRSGGKPSG